MMKRVRISAEGLSRMQNELRQMRGVIDMHQRQPRRSVYQQHQQQQQSSMQASQFSSQRTSTNTVRYRTQRNPELVPHNTPRDADNSEMQNLADIILQQAHRIEKQQRELQCLKLHYERQVSTIKSNAKMLEQQLEKLQGSVNQNKVQALGSHSQEIFRAVEKLQKCGVDLSKPQSIANHLLTKLLTSKTDQKY